MSVFIGPQPGLDGAPVPTSAEKRHTAAFQNFITHFPKYVKNTASRWQPGEREALHAKIDRKNDWKYNKGQVVADKIEEGDAVGRYRREALEQ